MRTPVTKVDFWNRRIGKERETDTEQRKYGEQKGLETPVVHTVNDVHEFVGERTLRNERMREMYCLESTTAR